MLRATFRSLLARKLRLLLSGLAIVLGVSFTAAALTLTDSIKRTFDDLFADLGAEVDAVVRSSTEIGDGLEAERPPVAADVLEVVRALPQVSAAEGEVAGYAQLVEADGKAYSPGNAPTLGVNYDTEPELSALRLRSGAEPRAPDEIALDGTTADRTGFVVGDRVEVVLQAGIQDFTVVGVFGVGDSNGFGGASVVAFESATAQRLVGTPGEFQELSVGAAPGVSQEQLVAALTPILPGGLEAITGQQAIDETTDAFDEVLSILGTFLLVFAGVALFVGGFLILNTFTILVAQRTRELALLRALGASRRQVRRSVLIEAGLVGLIGSGLGLAAGVGLAALLSSAFSSFLPDGPLVVQTRTVVISLLLGIGLTVLAAALPARRASRIPPVAAMRAAESAELPLRRRSLIGAVLLVLGIAGTVLGLAADALWLAFGAGAVFLGVVALAPAVAGPVLGVVGAVFRRRTPGRLGQLNAMRNPRRTSATAIALMIGLALVTAVSILGASLKSSITGAVNEAVTAAVIVQQNGGFFGIPADVAPVISGLPETGGTDVIRGSIAQIGDDDAFITAVTTGSLGRSFVLDAVAGELAALGPGTFLVSEDTADDRGFAVGDTVTVTLPRGEPQQVRLVGTYEENQLVGNWLFDLSIADGFRNSLVTALLLTPADGVGGEALRDAVNAATADFPTVEALTRKGFTDDIASQVDGFIAFVTVLLVLSVLIAVLGIVNTLALAVLERTREIGLLRAVGLTRRQTRSMIRVEAVLVSLFGALLGVVVGAGLGVAAQQALKDDIQTLTLPYGRVGVFVIAAALAGVLAALIPARRAARMDVLGAISTT